MSYRSSITIDEQQLARAQDALGTTGVQDTVERAMDEAIRRKLREALLRRLRTGEGVDLGPEILDEVRAPRTFP